MVWPWVVHVVLSLGYINAIIPILIILILLVAAAGLSRNWDLFSLFGLGTLAGIGLGSRGGPAKKTAYDQKGGKESVTAWNAPKAGKKNQEDKATWKSASTPFMPAFAKEYYDTYRTASGRDPSKMNVGENSPLVLSKGAPEGKPVKPMTIRQMNNYVAGKVRMALLNEPANFKPRTSVPQQPFSQGSDKPAFSSAENAIAWSLSSAGSKLRTERMKKLAAENPAAFNREYKKIVRNELYRKQFERHQAEIHKEDNKPQFMMPSDSERRKLGYMLPVGREFGRQELGKFKLHRGKYKIKFKSKSDK